MLCVPLRRPRVGIIDTVRFFWERRLFLDSDTCPSWPLLYFHNSLLPSHVTPPFPIPWHQLVLGPFSHRPLRCLPALRPDAALKCLPSRIPMRGVMTEQLSSRCCAPHNGPMCQLTSGEATAAPRHKMPTVECGQRTLSIP
eukprot:TRINITY_DN3508_c0_g1_i4.p2 TRINITY_DN3508_c0_g1~~TRINITY_DN3508_c0_g1_i4.p2  ORF type:complete len:141 (-),score=3.16 TRINITY_DN3508_c0_g1_i4:509-931(-)